MRFDAVFVSALALFALGCERATTTTSSVEKFNTNDTEIDFFEDLEKSLVVSNDDALHAFFLMADKDDGWVTYDERVIEAKRRGWLPESFDEPSTESAQVGWIATVACQVGHISGGLTMRIFGPIPRYAVRELKHEQILIGKMDSQSFSGLEFVDFLTRLDRMSKLSGGSVLETLPKAASEQVPSAQPRPPTGRFE